MKLMNYKKVQISSNAFHLYLNRVLVQIAIGLFSVFGVIFFYETFSHSIERVLALFLVMYGLTSVCAPIGAKLIKVIGMKRMMIYSIVFLVIAIGSLVLWDSNPRFMLFVYVITGTIYRVMYWVPYHIELTSFTDRAKRGKQMALFSNISDFVLGILPFFGGLILAHYGYDALFFIGLIMIMLSMYPLFYIEETKEEYKWSCKDLLFELFQKENRPMVLANIGAGIQGMVGIVVWPMFIFIVLEGRYTQIGLITTLTMLALIILRFVVGDILDRKSKKKVLQVGSVLEATGWLFKAFIETSLGVFLSHTYHSMGRAVNLLSFSVENYENAADNGHYIDEYTVLREVSLGIGRVIVLCLTLLLVSYYNIRATFIIAALATLYMTLLSKKIVLEK